MDMVPADVYAFRPLYCWPPGDRRTLTLDVPKPRGTSPTEPLVDHERAVLGPDRYHRGESATGSRQAIPPPVDPERPIE